MRDNWLSNRNFKSYDDIVDHCCFAWNKLADQPWRIMSIGLREWAHGRDQRALVLDETYVEVRGKWIYLYRAFDKCRDTIDFFPFGTRSSRPRSDFWARPCVACRAGKGRPSSTLTRPQATAQRSPN
jgi:hypothetical protein